MRRFASKDSKRDFYILYTLVFGVIAGFIYYQFAGNGKSLVWSHDGIPQHLNSLAYYGRYLREVLHTIFVEHKLELPMWDMNIGYGSDILTTLHYYVIGVEKLITPVKEQPIKSNITRDFLNKYGF